MGLECTCMDIDDLDEWWLEPSGFTTIKIGRRRRCCSCDKLIKPLSPCLRFERARLPRTEVEESIYCDYEVPLAPWWMCERCGEIYLNLSAIGYCIDITDSMESLLSEYQKMTGWKND